MPIWVHVVRLILGTRETRYYFYFYTIEIGLFPCTSRQLLRRVCMRIHYYIIIFAGAFSILLYCILRCTALQSDGNVQCTLLQLLELLKTEKERESRECVCRCKFAKIFMHKTESKQTCIRRTDTNDFVIYIQANISFEHLQNGNFHEMRERCGVLTSALTLFPKHSAFFFRFDLSVSVFFSSCCLPQSHRISSFALFKAKCRCCQRRRRAVCVRLSFVLRMH